MASVPPTSVTLLKDLARGTDSVRWTDFCRRYEPPMRDFLRARFPSVDADDVLQETLVALTRVLPDYQYTPDVHGHFRNYLIGILRNKAVDAVRKSAARSRLRETLADEARHAKATEDSLAKADETAWKEAAAEAAIEQLMANPAISATTREIFRHVALMHEPPEQVASRFGMSRENVDQVKSRMIRRLAALVRAMTTPD